MTKPYRRISRAELRDALAASDMDTRAAADRLGITQKDLYVRCHRLGISITDLRVESICAVAAESALDAPDVASDAFLAAAAVDMATLAMRVLALQADLDQRDHIIAVLTARLEDIGTRYASNLDAARAA